MTNFYFWAWVVQLAVLCAGLCLSAYGHRDRSVWCMAVSFGWSAFFIVDISIRRLI
jgi:hypothetical protein